VLRETPSEDRGRQQFGSHCGGGQAFGVAMEWHACFSAYENPFNGL